MTEKTSFKFTSVPNTAQYDLADWSYLLEHTHSGDVSSLEDAKRKAQQNENISFFFHMREGMYLSRNGYFAPDDNVFFSDVPWLGSAPMSDTYFVAETYDLGDAATRQWIKSKVESIKLGRSANAVTLDTVTNKSTPLTGGFIFVEFPDERGTKKIEESFNRLYSYQDADGKTKTAQEWLKAESKGRFTIDFVLHTKNAKDDNNPNGVYVALKNKWDTYKGKPDDVKRELEAAITIPSEWDIVYIVLPEGASRSDLFTSQEADCNWAGHDLEIVYLDSAVFKEENDRDWAVVAHETLHALGLPDLYLVGKRSFGWSMMSDDRVAWHLLGWEKLLLGWVDLDDFIWLKRGLLSEQIYDMLTDKGNLKGVVMFDDADDYAYVVEAAQRKGRKPKDRDEWNRNGLLLYRVELRGGAAQIVPLVAEWGASDQGGAPLASYPIPDIPTAPPALHGSIFLQVMGKGGEAQKSSIKVYIGKMAAWKPSPSATVLRDGESILSESGKYRLAMAVDGQLEFQVKTGDKFLTSFWNPVEESKLGNNYGFFCQVGRDGNVTVLQGTGPSNAKDQLWSWNTTLAPDHYFVWLVETPTGCHVSVYSGKDHTDPSRRKQGEKDLFDYPEDVDFAPKELKSGKPFYTRNLDYKLHMQSDGNLVLYQISGGKLVWRWSLFSDGGDLRKGAGARFSDDGRLQLTVPGTDKPVWQHRVEFSLDPNQSKRFFLGVDSDGKVAAYQGTGVDDSNKKKLYTVRSDSNFEAKGLNAGQVIYSPNLGYKLWMQDSDGNLVLYQVKDGKDVYRWSPTTNTADLRKGAIAGFSDDGRLQLTVSGGTKPVWQYQPKDEFSLDPNQAKRFFLSVGSDGSLVVYQGTGMNDANKKKLYYVVYPDNVAFEAKGLNTGQVIYSRKLDYKLWMQNDGNLVLYQVSDGKDVYRWSPTTNTNDLRKGAVAGFSDDGRLQLTVAGGTNPVWQYKGTFSLDPSQDKRFFMSVKPDGKAAVYQGAGMDDAKKKELYTVN